MVNSTRWSELTDTVRFHAGLADAANTPVEFRLLNGYKPILVGANENDDGVSLNQLIKAIDKSPHGATPLCKHIQEVTAQNTCFRTFAETKWT